MKRECLIALFLLTGGVGSGIAEQEAPQDEEVFPISYSRERYSTLIERSPFAPATPVVEEKVPSPPPPPFTGDYYITGIAKIGDQPYVTICSRVKQERFILTPGESYNGITLERVEWSEELGKSRAVVSKDGEEGVVSFDEVVIRAQPIPQPVPATAQVAPAQPPEGQAPPDMGRGGRTWGRGGWGRGGGGGYWGRRGQQIPGPR